HRRAMESLSDQRRRQSPEGDAERPRHDRRRGFEAQRRADRAAARLGHGAVPQYTNPRAVGTRRAGSESALTAQLLTWRMRATARRVTAASSRSSAEAGYGCA